MRAVGQGDGGTREIKKILARPRAYRCLPSSPSFRESSMLEAPFREYLL
jgi:hypothetical protein